VPPAEAETLAKSLVSKEVFRSHRPLYVDCNAISPDTALAIGEVISEAGCRFVDAGIVGGPPSPDGSRSPLLYASGEHARGLQSLTKCGLDIKILDAPVGSASALKMAFAGVSKGLTGIVALMTLVADQAGVGDAFRDQLQNSQPAALAWGRRQIPALPEKAYRWVSEMESLANLTRDYRGGLSLYAGLAEFYDWVATDGAHAPEILDLIRSFSD